MMVNLLRGMPTSIISDVIAKSNGYLTETEIVSYLEPFMIKGSITPFEDENGQSIIARLTQKAKFLPTANADEIYCFIKLCQQIDTQSMILLREVERVLKQRISNVFQMYTRSIYWHEDSNSFIRNGSGKSMNYNRRFKDLLNSKNNYFNNSRRCSTQEIIHNVLSFTDLSKAYYWFGDALLKAKIEVSETFGIRTPDVFSYGLWSITEYMRNLNAHLLASYRVLPTRLLTDKSGQTMTNQWISTKCNLGNFYGRISFLVYITTNFSDNYCKSARKEIKRLMLQIPKMTVNYLGMPPNWSNEPLWSNI